MNVHNDPASNAARRQSKNSIDSVVQPCPLQAPWLTIKPLRYAVAEDDSEISLPDDFKMPGLPKLTQHKYIARELLEQYVYLYHPIEHYLLEATYDSQTPTEARCVFGEPEADVIDAFPLLKQKKGDKVVMWLTHAPLTQKRIDVLEAQPDIIKKLGQHIDLAAAANDKQSHVFPLFNAKNMIAELLATKDEQLSWTATPLVCGIDEANLTADYHDATPDNSYGVNLIDPIGITSDLCREFSVVYERVMASLTTVQHPFQMAKLTRAIIDSEAEKAKGEPFNEVAFRRRAEQLKAPLRPTLTQAQKERAQAEADKKFEQVYKDALQSKKHAYKEDAEERYAERKAELEEVVHVQEMDQLLAKNQDGMQQIKDTLDELASDWLSWLKHDELDVALSWLDDTDEAQWPLKEVLVAAMVNNVNAVDDGAQLVSQWLTNFSKQLEKTPTEEPVPTQGIETHFFIGLGYGTADNSKKILVASTALKTINGVVAAIRAEVEKDYEALMGPTKVTATPATEVLLETVTTHLTRTRVSTKSGQLLWEHSIEVMSLRYGIQFAKVNMKLEDIAWDMQASYAAMAAVTGNHIIKQERQSSRSTRVRSQKHVTLYDLEQAAPTGDPFTRDQAKYPRVLAKHMKASEVFLANNQTLKTAYKAADTLFTSASQTKLVGAFSIMQVYNAMVLYDAMESDPSFKNQASYYTALLSVATTSLALVDKVFSKSFAGEDFTSYMKNKGAIAIGDKLTNGLKNSTKAALVSKMLDISEQKQIDFAEGVGKAASKFVNGAFRFVPILGGMAAVFSSTMQVIDSSGKQNLATVTLSVTSLLLNSAALGFMVMAFFFSGPLLMPIAVVLGLLAVAADIWRYGVEDDQVTLLLKSAYWGKEKYQYLAGMDSLKQKEAHFSDLILADETPQATLKGLLFELRAFCDYLFKPTVQITNQTKDDKGYSHFTLKVHLPNFVKGQSDVSLTVTGKHNTKGDTVLATTSAENRWAVNTLQGKLGMEGNVGTVTLTIDERQLEGYAIKRTGKASRNNKGTTGMNYSTYNMALSYDQPAGIPISLEYPKITIDDDKSMLAFWRNDTEVDDFHLKKETLEKRPDADHADEWEAAFLSR